MGAPWAPAYTCLHLGLWEQSVVYHSSMYLGHAFLWLRYIDDIFIWNGGVQELQEFLSELNINDNNIRLTYTYDSNPLPFLDLLITIKGGRLETKAYRKITAADTLLQASSHHPPSLIKGIPQ